MGVLTAKKAGTTYVTAKYKGKTSKKLKVVVKKAVSSGQTSTNPAGQTPANPSGQTPAAPSEFGSYTIKYDVNSKDKSDKLSGKSTQSVSGEILKFAAAVQPSGGKKFLGWFTKPTGGVQVYETYKPASNMTLYAHYTDQNVQTVEFILGCNYGGTNRFMSTIPNPYSSFHYRDFDWLTRTDTCGPLNQHDSENVKWKHTYVVKNKNIFTVDELPQPSVSGYEFAGWYTTEQIYDWTVKDGVKIESGQAVDAGVTQLFARFTKKITISFDDLRGGHYDDIVVDSYKSIKECGQRLPQPDIPGATFVGWTMDADNHWYSWSFPIITEDKYFYNCIEWYGFLCSDCLAISKHMNDATQYCESWCIGCFNAYNDDYHIFEETDHFTLYPVYKYHSIQLSFDPKGGYFPYDAKENWLLTFDDGEDIPYYNHKSVGILRGPDSNKMHIGSQPYGYYDYPGHEGEYSFDYGNGEKTMPIVRRQNYTFDKWVYLDDSGIEREFKFDTILTKTMTIYAKWNPGNCRVYFDPEDGELTQAECDRVGLTRYAYQVTTESTIAKDGKQLPVPVSSKGRAFLGWFKDNGDPVTADTKILADTTVFAHWGAAQNDKPAAGTNTSADNKTDNNKPDSSTTDNGTTNENKDSGAAQVSGITVTDTDWKTVDKDNHYEAAYGGEGNYINDDFGFVAQLFRGTEKALNAKVKWTSSNPNIIAVTAGEEIVFSSNWFDEFKFGTDTGDVVLTASSVDNPDVRFDIHVTVKEK